MTREHKLALIVGFSLFLVLGVLVSDHFSKARQVELAEDIRPATGRQMGAVPQGVRMAMEPGVAGASGAAALPAPAPQRNDLVELPLRSDRPSAQTVAQIQPYTQRTPTMPLVQVEPVRIDPVEVPEQSAPPVVAPAPQVQIPCQKHDIKDGDTLYRISIRYYGDGKLWEKLRDFNKLTSASLHEGHALQIPPRDVLLGKPYVPQSDPARAATTPTPETAPTIRDYVVKDGDTLVGIARKMLGSSKRYNEIAELNRSTLPDPEELTTGMKLRLPAR